MLKFLKGGLFSAVAAGYIALTITLLGIKDKGSTKVTAELLSDISKQLTSMKVTPPSVTSAAVHPSDQDRKSVV